MNKDQAKEYLDAVAEAHELAPCVHGHIDCALRENGPCSDEVSHLIPTRREAHRILLLSDARGQYIPRDFAREVKRECVTGVSAADWEVLELGPDHEWYWDTWCDVERNAVITDYATGIRYHIMQDGDCWLIENGAEYDDATDEYYVELTE